MQYIPQRFGNQILLTLNISSYTANPRRTLLETLGTTNITYLFHLLMHNSAIQKSKHYVHVRNSLPLSVYYCTIMNSNGDFAPLYLSPRSVKCHFSMQPVIITCCISTFLNLLVISASLLNPCLHSIGCLLASRKKRTSHSFLCHQILDLLQITISKICLPSPHSFLILF